ncbi:MAG: queuosine precursor transporter [Candidatus Eisenbacteria bacterium]|nr:queuosine precursor transporter [Candidatus Eisenbacteria bacterium]
MILLIALYVACELIANVTASKPVTLGPVTVPSAVFIYTLTFTLIDLINERLGKRRARRVVYSTLAANLLLAAYCRLAIALPAASFYADEAAFASVLGGTPRIVAASLTAYLVSSLIDTQIFSWWRERVGGPKWLRVLASNSVSTAADTAVFISIAFAGVMPVLGLMKGQYAVKMAITVLSLPLIYAVRRRAGAAPEGVES